MRFLSCFSLGTTGVNMEPKDSKFNTPVDFSEQFGPTTPTSPTSQPYNLVIFLGGTNDLGRCRLANDILMDIKGVLDIPLATGAKVLVMTVPECMARVGWLDERRGEVNSGLKAWAGAREDMLVFPFLSALLFPRL